MKYLFLLALIPLVYGKQVCLPEKITLLAIDLINDGASYNVSFDFSKKLSYATGMGMEVWVDLDTKTVYESDALGNCVSFLAYGAYLWEKCLPAEAVEIANLYQGFNMDLSLTGYQYVNLLTNTTSTALVYSSPQGDYPVLRKTQVGDNPPSLFMFSNPTTTIPPADKFTIPSPCPARITV